MERLKRFAQPATIVLFSVVLSVAAIVVLHRLPIPWHTKYISTEAVMIGEPNGDSSITLVAGQNGGGGASAIFEDNRGGSELSLNVFGGGVHVYILTRQGSRGVSNYALDFGVQTPKGGLAHPYIVLRDPATGKVRWSVELDNDGKPIVRSVDEADPPRDVK